jgi:hypothetical protein
VGKTWTRIQQHFPEGCWGESVSFPIDSSTIYAQIEVGEHRAGGEEQTFGEAEAPTPASRRKSGAANPVQSTAFGAQMIKANLASIASCFNQQLPEQPPDVLQPDSRGSGQREIHRRRMNFSDRPTAERLSLQPGIAHRIITQSGSIRRTANTS